MTMKVPGPFLKTEAGMSQIKAITPDEAKLWVRSFDDSYGGDFSFWSKALKSELSQNRGYTLIEERPVKPLSGREGLELLFEVTAQGQAHRYLAALFVFDGWLWFPDEIVIAEYAAPKKIFDAYLAEVREACATIEN